MRTVEVLERLSCVWIQKFRQFEPTVMNPVELKVSDIDGKMRFEH